MRRVIALLTALALMVVGCGDAPAPATVLPPTEVPPTDAPGDSAPTAAASSGERRPGWITGTATDSQGRPLAGAHVTIRSGSVAMGSGSYYEAVADAAGHYAQQVPGTSYAITAYAPLTYNGRNYQLWLAPVDGIESPNQDVRGGLVKDFVLKLAGAKPAAQTAPDNRASYYGGEIDLGDDGEFRTSFNPGAPPPPPYPAGATVRLELTPDGPLLDGSPGTVLTYDLDPATLATAVLRDVPLGDYTARATLVAAGGTTPLQVAAKNADGQFGAPQPGDTARLIFTPDRMGAYGVSLVSLYILRP
jgi:hypothetical protein